MGTVDSCRQLAGELRRHLAGGLTPGREVMNYIDSTFSHPSLEELTALLEDENNCERDSLLALLFTPDESLQISLEPLLEASAFTAGDRSTIVRCLTDPPPVVEMDLPDDRGRIQLSMPASGAERFVDLMHPEKQLPAVLKNAIRAHVDEEVATRIKVMLRNSRCRLGRRDVAYVSRCLQKFDAGCEEDLACLEYALCILADSPAPADLYQVLARRKKLFFKQLQNALKLRKMLRGSNPETVMLRGGPIGSIDTAEAGRLIAMIDRISTALFGRTEPLEPPALELEYEVLERLEALNIFH